MVTFIFYNNFKYDYKIRLITDRYYSTQAFMYFAERSTIPVKVVDFYDMSLSDVIGKINGLFPINANNSSERYTIDTAVAYDTDFKEYKGYIIT